MFQKNFFYFQLSIKREKIQQIIDSSSYYESTNVIFIGNSGTEKPNSTISVTLLKDVMANVLKINKSSTNAKDYY